MVHFVRKASALDDEVTGIDVPVGCARALVAYHWDVKTGLARFRYEGGGLPSIAERLQTKYLSTPDPMKTPEDDPRH